MELFEAVMKVSLGALRIGALLLAMPIFSASNVPIVVRFFIAVSFSVLLMPAHANLPVNFFDRNAVFLLAAFREVGLGLVMGFSLRLVSLLVSMSLEIASLQMGFSMANIFDPVNNEQLSVLSAFGVVLMVLLFFGMNLHHDLLRALVKSYELLPPGLPEWKMGVIIERLAQFLKEAFAVSVRLSLPVLAAMLLSNILMGIISRTAPQMNLFFNAAVIVNIVTGLFLVSLTLPRMMTEIGSFSRLLMKHGFGIW